MAVPAQDRRIAHRYRLKTACGRSGLGRIWHAQDTLLGRQVEVREVVIPSWLAEAERRVALASAMRELRAVARLNHPGVVTVFDVVNDHDEIFIVTELPPGPTLADLVRIEGPLPPLRVAEIGARVASVLEAAHGAGVVHRDLKPANVMVQPDGGMRLAGFGATSFHSAPPFAVTALATGSPPYVAAQASRACWLSISINAVATSSTSWTSTQRATSAMERPVPAAANSRTDRSLAPRSCQ
jgi:eukaryotic-like serine/threonine-protein kinase